MQLLLMSIEDEKLLFWRRLNNYPCVDVVVVCYCCPFTMKSGFSDEDNTCPAIAVFVAVVVVAVD